MLDYKISFHDSRFNVSHIFDSHIEYFYAFELKDIESDCVESFFIIFKSVESLMLSLQVQLYCQGPHFTAAYRIYYMYAWRKNKSYSKQFVVKLIINFAENCLCVQELFSKHWPKYRAKKWSLMYTIYSKVQCIIYHIWISVRR